MKKSVFAVLLTFVLCSQAEAETIKDEMPVCISKDYLDQFFVDKQSAAYLMSKNICVRPKSGLRVSVLERNWSGQVKVRIYFDDGTSVIAWTPSINIQ